MFHSRLRERSTCASLSWRSSSCSWHTRACKYQSSQIRRRDEGEGGYGFMHKLFPHNVIFLSEGYCATGFHLVIHESNNTEIWLVSQWERHSFILSRSAGCSLVCSQNSDVGFRVLKRPSGEEDEMRLVALIFFTLLARGFWFWHLIVARQPKLGE